MQIRELEEKMWRAAQSRNKAAFLEVVDENAVMVCGGFRCSGADYAGIISEFDCAGFVIEQFETVCGTPDMVQVMLSLPLPEIHETPTFPANST